MAPHVEFIEKRGVFSMKMLKKEERAANAPQTVFYPLRNQLVVKAGVRRPDR